MWMRERKTIGHEKCHAVVETEEKGTTRHITLNLMMLMGTNKRVGHIQHPLASKAS